MRIWTLHPKYLDARGLVALWREALLAQAVLRGRTAGYLHHPQLERFRSTASPAGAIAEYLRVVEREATRRGYNFDAKRIGPAKSKGKIRVRRGQLEYEWQHLVRKLEQRAPVWRAGLGETKIPQLHPLFRMIAGGVEDWEKL